ncbi:hypothetical protein AAY473_021247 [Plecturocebus cupreus]
MEQEEMTTGTEHGACYEAQEKLPPTFSRKVGTLLWRDGPLRTLAKREFAMWRRKRTAFLASPKWEQRRQEVQKARGLYRVVQGLEAGLSNSLASVSRVARITGMCSHIQLIFVFLVEMRFHYVGQVCLKLLTSTDLPTSTSQSAGITDVSHRPQH